MTKIIKVFDSISEIVFPENIYCICCGDLIPGSRVHGLCDACVEKLKWLSENPFESRLDEFSFDSVTSLVQYDYYAQKIVHNLKFHGKSYIANNIGRLMGELFLTSKICDDPIIAPVPMYIGKERSRGYNQAALLAERIAGICDAEYIKDLLIKTKRTDSMRTARAFGRLNALDNSIELNTAWARKIKGRNILIVDDVVTTGATAEKCSEAIKMAGPSSINILSFAAVNYKGN